MATSFATVPLFFQNGSAKALRAARTRAVDEIRALGAPSPLKIADLTSRVHKLVGPKSPFNFMVDNRAIRGFAETIRRDINVYARTEVALSYDPDRPPRSTVQALCAIAADVNIPLRQSDTTGDQPPSPTVNSNKTHTKTRSASLGSKPAMRRSTAANRVPSRPRNAPTGTSPRAPPQHTTLWHPDRNGASTTCLSPSHTCRTWSTTFPPS